eukprot:3939009-Rhodomonas_salina.1
MELQSQNTASDHCRSKAVGLYSKTAWNRFVGNSLWRTYSDAGKVRFGCNGSKSLAWFPIAGFVDTTSIRLSSGDGILRFLQGCCAPRHRDGLRVRVIQCQVMPGLRYYLFYHEAPPTVSRSVMKLASLFCATTTQ